MAGGESEPIEHNPMLGWRGIRRDLQSAEQFRLQVEAFKRLWKAGYENLGVMFPMVSHPDQFTQAKAMMANWGVDVENVALGIMIEIPASAIMIEGLPAGRHQVRLIRYKRSHPVHDRHRPEQRELWPTCTTPATRRFSP